MNPLTGIFPNLKISHAASFSNGRWWIDINAFCAFFDIDFKEVSAGIQSDDYLSKMSKADDNDPSVILLPDFVFCGWLLRVNTTSGAINNRKVQWYFLLWEKNGYYKLPELEKP